MIKIKTFSQIENLKIGTDLTDNNGNYYEFEKLDYPLCICRKYEYVINEDGEYCDGMLYLADEIKLTISEMKQLYII